MTGNFDPVASVDVYSARDVGFKEGPNNSNPYSEWQYGNRYNPYCNSATCMWAYEAGFRFWPECTYKEKGEAYTPTYAQRAKARGVWRDKKYRAKKGDDVEFDWGNNGLIDHVEKVVADDGVTVITVGANTSDGVFYRRRDRTYISNFVALTEAGQTVKPIDWAAIKDLIAWKDRVSAPRRVDGKKNRITGTLKRGDHGRDVLIMNQLLHKAGYLKAKPMPGFGLRSFIAIREYKKQNGWSKNERKGNWFGKRAAQSFFD